MILIKNNMTKVYIKDKFKQSIVSKIYTHGYLYDRLETDINFTINIKKKDNVPLLLNNRIFSFISDIEIEFKNDFDNKINLPNLPDELNRLINSYLVLEDSIKINLYNLLLFEKNYKMIKTPKMIKYIYHIKFKKEEKKKIMKNNLNDITEFTDKIPNYMIKYEYGVVINSTIERNLNMNVTCVNYNNDEFSEFTKRIAKEYC